jgi:hypothetical protein
LNNLQEKLVMRYFFISLVLLSVALPSGIRSQNHSPFRKDFPDIVPHPLITDIVSAISKDSLTANMQSMVDFGTRYMYAENRREVAEWIAGKFLSYGVSDVVLDSFKIMGDTVPEDTVWQYNVVATIEGTSAPDEIYILGTHHDDYSDGNLYQIAPGADDNASGCAVALEMARVFQLKGFHPASTIRLVTFAAEELMGHKGYSGSIYYGDKVKANQEDLRLMINNDMVANTTGAGFEMVATVMETGKNQWAGELTLSSATLYSTLEIINGEYPTSDATYFYDLGYSVAGFQEFGLYWTYHTVHDSVNHCNMDICKEAAKATCAILLNEQLTPVPQDPTTSGKISSIMLSWKQTANANVTAYKIYRSDQPDSGYVQIAQVAGPDSQYEDSTAAPGMIHYYRVSSVDTDNYESVPSNQTFGAIAPKDRELLVVKDSKGINNNPPDSAVIAFYQQVFRDLPYEFSDASATDSLDLTVLNRYQKILWLSNSYSNQANSSFLRHRDEISMYIRNSGKFFLSAFQPSFLIANNTTSGKIFTGGEAIYDYFKITKVERKPTAALNGAYPGPEEYDTLWIDRMKCPDTVIGHLYNVECIHPASGATLIYHFNSGYDSTTPQGSMKGKPVGLEYLGNDFNVIVLSVPLYFLDTTDAKTLVELIVHEKFKTPTGIDEGQKITAPGHISISPNPCAGQATIVCNLITASDISIFVINVSGETLLRYFMGWKEPGIFTEKIDVSNLPAGIYLVRLKTARQQPTCRFLLLLC